MCGGKYSEALSRFGLETKVFGPHIERNFDKRVDSKAMSVIFELTAIAYSGLAEVMGISPEKISEDINNRAVTRNKQEHFIAYAIQYLSSIPKIDRNSSISIDGMVALGLLRLTRYSEDLTSMLIREEAMVVINNDNVANTLFNNNVGIFNGMHQT